MKPGSVEDVASAQAVVLWDLSLLRDPDPDLMRLAGVDNASFTVTGRRTTAFDRVFRPGKVLRERTADRGMLLDQLDKPMRRALAAAAAAEGGREHPSEARAAS